MRPTAALGLTVAITFYVVLSLKGNSIAAKSHDQHAGPADTIMVSSESFKSKNAREIIDSNSDVIRELLRGHLRRSEISRAALESAYVDAYLGEVNNGGFAQFVFNIGWNADVVDLVRDGLRDMGAHRHLALFEEGVAGVEALGPEMLDAYPKSQSLGGKNPTRDRLNAINNRFFDLEKTEALAGINAAWLRRQPSLRVLSADQLRQEIQLRISALPDGAMRAKMAQDAAPSYIKLIRALCKESGQTLVTITAGDPTLTHDGHKVRRLTKEELAVTDVDKSPIWFFITDQGLHMLAQANGKAAMLNAKTNLKVAELDTTGSW